MSARPPPIHIESVGVGPPLVLLHGFALHGGLFAPILPALAAHHRVHVVDLPGHGHSAPLSDMTLDAVAGSIAEALPQHDAPLVLLGWSLGGAVALHWARAEPQRIARLVLVCTTPAFIARDHWPHAMAPETLARFGDELRVAYKATLQRFLTLQVQASERGRATLATLRQQLFARGEPPPAVVDATLALLMAIDLRGELAQVVAPSLVISGSRDTLAPAAAGAWLAGALPDARYVELEGAAHAPFLSHTDAFIAIVNEFLDAR